jgi:hypothetical protein
VRPWMKPWNAGNPGFKPQVRQQFPFIKNGEIPSKHSCEFVRAADKVGYRRGVPARASRGPNAAFVERYSSAELIGHIAPRTRNRLFRIDHLELGTGPRRGLAARCHFNPRERLPQVGGESRRRTALDSSEISRPCHIRAIVV